MYVRVNVKQLGSRKKPLVSERFYLEKCPETVEALITEAVKTCVTEYNERAERMQAKPLRQEEIDAMSEVGKIAFGINYNGKKAVLSEAVDTALLAFRDGLYKVFLGETCLEELDTKVSLNEQSELTFLKLTMLTGRMW